MKNNFFFLAYSGALLFTMVVNFKSTLLIYGGCSFHDKGYVRYVFKMLSSKFEFLMNVMLIYCLEIDLNGHLQLLSYIEKSTEKSSIALVRITFSFYGSCLTQVEIRYSNCITVMLFKYCL